MAYDGGPDILETPTRNHGVIARNQETRQNTHIADERERRTTCQFAESARRIGPTMTTDNELTNHTGNAQQQDTEHINHDKHGSAILSRHIGESPDVAQANGRTCRGQDDTQFATEISPLAWSPTAYRLG